MRGYRKAAVVLVLGALVCLLAAWGIEGAAPYSALAGLGSAFCAANLFEHRSKNAGS